MFGAFRCSKDAPNNLEYVDLSGNSSVDARNYTVLACDQCRERKLKCSGDPSGCQRCRATGSACNYRSSTRSADPSASKRRKSATPPASSHPSGRRKQRKRSLDSKKTAEEAASTIHVTTGMGQSTDANDGFWTPMTMSEPVIPENLLDWDGLRSKNDLGLDIDFHGHGVALPMGADLQDSPPLYSALMDADENFMDDLVLTPPPTADPSGTTSVDSMSLDFGGRRCDCIGSLADILERISDDSGSDADGADRVDDLLGYLGDGIETCKTVLPCSNCSVATTNSMFVVTIIHHLATISQGLCRQLLTHRQKSKTRSATDAPSMLLKTGVYVGKYQVRSVDVSLECIHAVVSMHLRELERLMGQLQKDVRKTSRAFKLMSDAADVVKKGAVDLKKVSERVTLSR